MCGSIKNFGSVENYTKDGFNKIIHRGPDHQSFSNNINWNVEFCRLLLK